jgi:predicted ATP-grasp superfamily ATP-dependent carboligase
MRDDFVTSDVAGTSALITDVDRRKALPIIRALGRANVRVLGISCNRLPMGGMSRYCSKVFHCADYNKNPARFLVDLEEICQRERPDVFYPIEDKVLELCVRNNERWSPYTAALLPGPDALELAYDKWKTLQVANDLGIPVPKSYCPDRVDQIGSMALDCTSGYIIKPRKSSGSRGIEFVDDVGDLVKIYTSVSKRFERPIIQERLPEAGSGVGVFTLIEPGKEQPVAIFGHRRLREYPASGGPSTMRKSYRNDALIEQSLKLLRRIGCVGVAMVEYKFDLRTAKYRLIEVNPRFWGSLQLAIHAGVNFPVLYHKLALGQSVVPVLDYREDIYCRWLWPGDILHFISNPNRLHMQPSFFKFTGSNLAYDIISADDPLPMFGVIVESLRKLIRGR